MQYVNDITALVGETPLVALDRLFGNRNMVLAKLEQYNPCGSVKDRAALAMIDNAVESGKLGHAGTIIEATSGNTGIALAFIAAIRKHRLIVVMPDSMSIERRKLLAFFGADVELTPAHLGMEGAIARAEELHASLNDSFLVRQFDNLSNVEVHEKTTAVEILRDTDEKVDVIVAGVGTGGTITGIARKVKQKRPTAKVVAVEPANCAALSGEPPGPHVIQGIGAGFIPSIMEKELIDDVVTVTDGEAMEWMRRIAHEEGILAGISSGAAACGTAKYIKNEGLENAVIVTLFPDTGERYLSVAINK
ncbi:cysteine synthase A [Prosthecochloris sp. SCSIO W1101]|uniref:cysteine synthase A n=1 Tax=Prosthecochloris sp. SCSIO W1101 TaxID=2992242 RepID=UPI00223E10E3|nr:cysteine synthase A [Prosthecochloris sp. SCSIO W1101]UZJ40644.1 cysteine synthase A [Prosthecochloris sp. SCSIO W1101]